MLVYKGRRQETFRGYILRWIVKDNPDGSRPIGNGYSVKRDGTVLKNDQAVTTHDYTYDPDLASDRAIDEFFYDERSKKRFIDVTIATAYFPIPKDISNPKVLHKDHNYKNQNADNLEWVDQYSKEYLDYLNDRQKDIDKRNEELGSKSIGH